MFYLAIILNVSTLQYINVVKYGILSLSQSYYEIGISDVLVLDLKSIFTNGSNTQALLPLRFQV